MQVSDKGQVTIPKHIRTAAGVLPGSEVSFALQAGKIVISPVAGPVKADRKAALRAAAAKVHKSMGAEFRQMSAQEISAFIRPDKLAKPSRASRG